MPYVLLHHPYLDIAALINNDIHTVVLHIRNMCAFLMTLLTNY